MNYWLMKTEPSTYAWEDLVKDGKTMWEGVRNYEARNNIRKMQRGDLVFVYHSVKDREIVGLAEVVSEPYPDPTAKKGDWSVVDIVPKNAFENKISLKDIKTEPAFKDLKLVTRTRLSVMPIDTPSARRLIKMGESG